MKFLKARVCESDSWLDGKTEFFNLDKVLTIRPNGNGETVKILMGAGLYWDVYTDSLEVLDLGNRDLVATLQGEEVGR